MRLAIALGMLLMSLTAQAEEPDAAKLIARVVKLKGDLLSEIKGIEDKATATGAKDRLSKLEAKVTETYRDIATVNVPATDREEFRKRLDREVAPLNEKIDNEIARLMYLHEDAYDVLRGEPSVKEAARRIETKAKAKAIVLGRVLREYMLKNDGIAPVDIVRMLREMGITMDTYDPWDCQYQIGVKAVDDEVVYFVYTLKQGLPRLGFGAERDGKDDRSHVIDSLPAKK